MTALLITGGVLATGLIGFMTWALLFPEDQ